MSNVNTLPDLYPIEYAILCELLGEPTDPVHGSHKAGSCGFGSSVGDWWCAAYIFIGDDDKWWMDDRLRTSEEFEKIPRSLTFEQLLEIVKNPVWRSRLSFPPLKGQS